jgi:predicted enzyme involved in methoxymalonyl-ACP biosynthesis
MNFSGTRYTREELERLAADPNFDIHVIEVQDRFGSYGIVGIAVMDLTQGTLTDLAFSCRIQSKKIEHALLAYLLQRYPTRPFRARWRKTERNAPAGKVFADLGFIEQGENAGVTLLEYRNQAVAQFDFIKVEAAEGEKLSA